MHEWFASADPRPDAEAQLFLFPHAGGSPLGYLSWAASLPRGLELRAARLPGRPGEGGEAPRSVLGPLVEELCEAVEAELDGRPYLFFGHSLGALLAYRLAVALAGRGAVPPALLGVSGWAPELPNAAGLSAVHRMPDAELLATVGRLGLVHTTTARERALLEAAVPSLRADFALVAGFDDDGAVAPCPIAAYTGAGDPLVPPRAMHAWSGRTTSFLGVREFPGDHFFLFEHAMAIQLDLDRRIRRQSAVPAPADWSSPLPQEGSCSQL
ncbi:thioesterase II family protein [Streptomyces sp. A012304]|uniref:thioesterase II family protein n=1 Tax=Streptomyces sp. A012304 TaxID=375446 RepID=UPI0022317121|nr:alpha/beta fold hydrolase [Streptomyces sp. A012304]GKQ35327.1 thioesterase [Streptomyces sp. A012304]